MKNYFKRLLEHPRALSVFTILILVFGMSVVWQWQTLGKRQVELSRAKAKHEQMTQLEERAARNDELLATNLHLLRQYEERVPYADGYVWLGKFLNQAAPGLQVTVDPPEIGYELISVPDYCTGFFRIRGTSSVENLTELLRDFEAKLPFANVEEVQFNYADEKKETVKFAINLLMIMRLHQASNSEQTSTIASK